MASSAPRSAGARLAGLILWLAFAACLTIGGWILIHACAIRVPGFGALHWLGWDACPAAQVADRSLPFIPPTDRAEALVAEISRLEAEVAAKRAQCPECVIPPPEPPPPPPPPPEPEPEPPPPPQPKPELPEPPPEPPPPPPPPPPEPPPSDDLILPKDGEVTLDLLEGCWRDKMGDGRNTSTGLELRTRFCFDKNGTGARSIEERGTDLRCNGPMQGRVVGSRILIDLAQAGCSNGTWFPPGQFVCEPSMNAGAPATCTLTEISPDGRPEPPPDQTRHQFTRVGGNQ